MGLINELRTLCTMWEKLKLLYNILTNISKSARTTIHPLKGFPTAGHRKIVSILFGEI